MKVILKLIINKLYKITLGNESFLIEQKARIICFIINKKYYKRFIYSCKHLNEVIKELKIEYYSTTKDELDNSLEIEISEDKVYELLFYAII